MNSINEQVMVSVSCTVYNHEAHLKECLDGLVRQKTNFRFEVLVHDDASTDNSVAIIREYEQKYPEIIRPIYQIENQYSKKIPITFMYQYPRAKGKYIAFCEGDDYWCDENKLQNQFDLMEAHPECTICTHKTLGFEDGSGRILRSFPGRHIEKCFLSDEECVLSQECYFSLAVKTVYTFQTSCYFIRKDIVLQYVNENPKYRQGLSFGDVPLLLWCLYCGKMAYINSIYSHYRMNQVASWNGMMKHNLNRNVLNTVQTLNMWSEYDAFTSYKYTDYIKRIKARSIYFFDRLLLLNEKSRFNLDEDLLSRIKIEKRMSYRFWDYLVSAIALTLFGVKLSIKRWFPFISSFKQKLKKRIN